PLTYFSFISPSGSGPRLDLHSFPTRRSSDLLLAHLNRKKDQSKRQFHTTPLSAFIRSLGGPATPRRINVSNAHQAAAREREGRRSEEHTSELQSPYDLVCRLLLEKKNQKKNT